MRTFVPFVAGVAQMSRIKFTGYNAAGGAIWVGGLAVIAGAWKARRKAVPAVLKP